MPESDLLNLAQTTQLSEQLTNIMQKGFGSVSLVIDRWTIRRIRSAAVQLYPEPAGILYPVKGPALADLLGPWYPSFYLSLAAVMGHGSGKITIQIEAGRVRSILYELDSRARTGKTGPLQPATT